MHCPKARNSPIYVVVAARLGLLGAGRRSKWGHCVNCTFVDGVRCTWRCAPWPPPRAFPAGRPAGEPVKKKGKGHSFPVVHENDDAALRASRGLGAPGAC